MSNPTEVTQGELVPEAAAAARMVAEHSRQAIDLAQTYPRDLAKARESALNELAAFPAMAEKSFYSIPYKERKQDANGRWVEETTYVEGPSINAANHLMQKYGRARLSVRIDHVDEESCTVTGVFDDFESITRIEKQMRVSRWFKPRNGQPYLLNEERWNNRILIAISKAQRNAAIAGLPTALVEEYLATAKKLAKDSKKGSRKSYVQMFAEHGIDKDSLLAVLGIDSVKKVTDKHRDHMNGMLAALNDGGTTASEILASIEPSTPGEENHQRDEEQKANTGIQLGGKASFSEPAPKPDAKPEDGGST